VRGSRDQIEKSREGQFGEVFLSERQARRGKTDREKDKYIGERGIL
jgi:hypothetical protein